MGLTVYGGGGKPEEEKTVTAGTSAIVVLPSSGKTIKKVTVNPTPSQSKSVTPKESAQTVSPDSGKLLSSVSVGAIQTEEKTVTAGTSATTVTPTSGKYIKKVTVNPTPSQSKTVTPTSKNITVSPDSGKLLSKVVVNGDSDLIPQNIKSGIDIFGVTGTFNNNSGIYLWNKYTYTSNTKGDWVDYVVSNDSSKYPNGAVHTDGYWYELSDTANLTVATGTVYSTSRTDVSVELGKEPKYFGISALNATIGTETSGDLYSYTCTLTVSESGTYLNVLFDSEGYIGYNLKSIQFTWFAIG